MRVHGSGRDDEALSFRETTTLTSASYLEREMEIESAIVSWEGYVPRFVSNGALMRRFLSDLTLCLQRHDPKTPGDINVGKAVLCVCSSEC